MQNNDNIPPKPVDAVDVGLAEAPLKPKAPIVGVLVAEVLVPKENPEEQKCNLESASTLY